MLDAFRTIADAYHCSLAISPRLGAFPIPSGGAVIGIRRMESLMDSIQSFDVVLAPEDVSRMDRLARSLADKQPR